MSLWRRLTGASGEHTEDSVETIKDNLANGRAVMLDVRSQEERDAGYLKDSVFIPITEIKALPENTTDLPQLDKSQIVYCH